MWLRVLLIVLVPLVFVSIYIEGQKYDPPVVQFSENPLEAELKALLPDTIGLNAVRGRIRIYYKNNLYEYINGHAEYFISAGFRALIVKEYSDRDTSTQFRVEAYRMNRAIEALGVLNDEAPSEAIPVSIGQSAYLSEGAISFFKGPYYVKITKLKGRPELEKIATAISERIKKEDNSLEILKDFPDIGKPRGTEYHRESYRGISFLNDVVARKYALGKRELIVFLKRSDRKEAEDIPKKLINYFKSNGITFDIIDVNSKKLFAIEDPYEGRWYIYLGKERIVGMSGIKDRRELKEILEMIEERGIKS